MSASRRPHPPILAAACLAAAVLAGPAADAALEVEFATTAGPVVVELDFTRAPRASANLIALAGGSRNWLDPATGEVRAAPFYDGLEFHHVTNEPAAMWIETGSPGGSGVDGPGYTFPDEIDPALSHQPYVLAMANDGPNTNGSRIVLTGNTPLPARDGLNTVFGAIPDAASRAVVDAIVAAGPGAVTITAATVRRTSPEALAFDEHAVGLPAVQPLAPALQVAPGTSTVALVGITPAGSLVVAHASANLLGWAHHFRSFTGLDDPPPGPARLVDTADLPARFYRFARVDSPAAGGPSHLANRTLTITGPQFDTLIYQFDATGLAGSYQNLIFGDPWFSGSFVVRDEIPAVFGPYGFSVLLYLFDEELGGAPFNHIRGGIDTIGPAAVTGRHSTRFLGHGLGLVFEDHGPLDLTRP